MSKEVYLPCAPGRKYPNSGKEHRHHLDPSPVNKAIKKACRQAGINKRVSALTFRHSFATHLLQRRTNIRTIQALPGHKDISTTMIYTHALQQGSQSPQRKNLSFFQPPYGACRNGLRHLAAGGSYLKLNT